MRKFFFGLCAAMGALLVRGSIIVSDVQVFSGYPWKEVVVGYTITGTDSSADNFRRSIRLTAMDKSANKTYVVETGARTLTGAELSEGWHLMRWDAASQGAKFSSSNAVFTVSVVSWGGVQLWANGPYWAECNVGATKPEEDGYYFWWGGTAGYKRNASDDGWVSVKTGASFSFSSSNCPTYFMSRSTLQSKGYVDSTGNLTMIHDAARVHLGAPWRMPTSEEIKALISNCTTTWMTHNGVYGRLVTGKGAYASKSIFLPATNSSSSSGDYWSSTSTTDAGDPRYAWCLFFNNSDDFVWSSRIRYAGRPVRPLRGFAQ